jgi:hypothetical protein
MINPKKFKLDLENMKNMISLIISLTNKKKIQLVLLKYHITSSKQQNSMYVISVWWHGIRRLFIIQPL